MKKLTMEAIRRVEAKLCIDVETMQLAKMLRMLMQAQAEVDDEKLARKRASLQYSHYM